MQIFNDQINELKQAIGLYYLDFDYNKNFRYYVTYETNGKVVKEGGNELITKIDQEGYDWLKEELGLEDDDNSRPNIVLGSCAVKKTLGDKNE